MSEDLKDMLERTGWTFIEAFIGALTVAPLVGVEAETLQLAALAGGGAALAVIKTYAKKQHIQQQSWRQGCSCRILGAAISVRANLSS